MRFTDSASFIKFNFIQNINSKNHMLNFIRGLFSDSKGLVVYTKVIISHFS